LTLLNPPKEEFAKANYLTGLTLLNLLLSAKENQGFYLTGLDKETKICYKVSGRMK